MIALIILLVLLAVIVVAALSARGIYNSLVALRNRFKNAYAQIDVQLKRRYDLIPNLVETAKGYLKHEHETLEDVIKARNVAMAASQGAAANPADAGAVRAWSPPRATSRARSAALWSSPSSTPTSRRTRT